MKAIEAYKASKTMQFINEIETEIAKATSRGEFSVKAVFVECNCGLCNSTIAKIVEHFIGLDYKVEVERDTVKVKWA